jgi:hypothetical protein
VYHICHYASTDSGKNPKTRRKARIAGMSKYAAIVRGRARQSENSVVATRFRIMRELGSVHAPYVVYCGAYCVYVAQPHGFGVFGCKRKAKKPNFYCQIFI